MAKARTKMPRDGEARAAHLGPRRVAPGEYFVCRDDRTDTCEGCGARIVWVSDGKHDDDRRKFHPVSIDTIRRHPLLPDEVRLGLTHYADCPKAGDFKQGWRSRQRHLRRTKRTP